jgi:hypothetical protein
MSPNKRTNNKSFRCLYTFKKMILSIDTGCWKIIKITLCTPMEISFQGVQGSHGCGWQ